MNSLPINAMAFSKSPSHREERNASELHLRTFFVNYGMLADTQSRKLTLAFKTITVASSIFIEDKRHI
ncbi:hypothetical protein GCM10022414_00870 [Zhongshania borealis]|uniref:Uncharacterized protein n=1 Tax=Zhongshania borealis TaxID=889488 RepID=A0ABP7W6C3_9GAMM